jgi:hypothetical protein
MCWKLYTVVVASALVAVVVVVRMLVEKKEQTDRKKTHPGVLPPFGLYNQTPPDAGFWS